MFLNPAHTRPDVYKISQELALQCNRITKKFPPHERFGFVQQIRRATTSIHLNLAEVCSRKSQKERNRYFEMSKGSVPEIDSAIGITFKLEYISLEELQPLGNSIIKTFKLLSGMI